MTVSLSERTKLSSRPCTNSEPQIAAPHTLARQRTACSCSGQVNVHTLGGAYAWLWHFDSTATDREPPHAWVRPHDCQRQTGKPRHCRRCLTTLRALSQQMRDADRADETPSASLDTSAAYRWQPASTPAAADLKAADVIASMTGPKARAVASRSPCPSAPRSSPACWTPRARETR